MNDGRGEDVVFVDRYLTTASGFVLRCERSRWRTIDSIERSVEPNLRHIYEPVSSVTRQVTQSASLRLRRSRCETGATRNGQLWRSEWVPISSNLRMSDACLDSAAINGQIFSILSRLT